MATTVAVCFFIDHFRTVRVSAVDRAASSAEQAVLPSSVGRNAERGGRPTQASKQVGMESVLFGTLEAWADHDLVVIGSPKAARVSWKINLAAQTIQKHNRQRHFGVRLSFDASYQFLDMGRDKGRTRCRFPALVLIESRII